MVDDIILVDERNQQIGTGKKMPVHEEGKLHRAFSIFIFNSKGELMLQRRAKHKYHCGGLWTNTCCSHPRPDKNIKEEAEKRLQEEMGFSCDLKEIFSFDYQICFENGLIENEFDHVFVGKYEEEPILNKEEADDWRWISGKNLQKELKNNPEVFTYWLMVIMEDYSKKLF